MKYAILITAANIVFWVALHFGTAAFFTYALPEKTKNRLFDYKKRFFTVSEKEMRFYRKIKLPFWKDKLPQFNKDFNKRNLESEITPEYIKRFLLLIWYGLPPNRISACPFWQRKSPHWLNSEIMHPSFMEVSSGDIITYLNGISGSIFLFVEMNFFTK